MNPARGLVDAAGMGLAYHALWWRLHARTHARPTEWSRRHGALFIHVPKAAGLSLYQSLGMERPPDSHAPAAALARGDPAFFAAAFRFAVVRNPWDRLVSAFHYLRQGSPYEQDRRWAARRLAGVEDFAGFMAAMRRPVFRNRVMAWRHFLPQSAFLTIGGKLATDRLIAFERLDEGAAEVADRLGLTYRPAHVNRSARADWRGYYDDRSAALAARLYAGDIALTGARFDPDYSPALPA